MGYDQGMVLGDAGAALENLLAISLYKHILGREDTTGKTLSLNYLRTKEGREVDFCIVAEEAAEKMIEVKAADSNLDKNLRYFSERYPFQAVQVVGRQGRVGMVTYNLMDVPGTAAVSRCLIVEASLEGGALNGKMGPG